MKAMKDDQKRNLETKWSDGNAPSPAAENAMIEPTGTAVDCVDALPENLSFTGVDITVLVISIGSYLFDTGSDIAVAHSLHKTGYVMYFWLTIMLIVLPAIVMAGFSLKWYICDKKWAEDQGKQKVVTPIWVLRVIGVCFHMGPVMR